MSMGQQLPVQGQKSLSGWVSKQSSMCCYLDIVGCFLLNNFHEPKTYRLAPTDQEPQDSDLSFEKHQPLLSPWELATMLSTHTGMVGHILG